VLVTVTTVFVTATVIHSLHNQLVCLALSHTAIILSQEQQAGVCMRVCVRVCVCVHGCVRVWVRERERVTFGGNV
jgi:hypothetical protein